MKIEERKTFSGREGVSGGRKIIPEGRYEDARKNVSIWYNNLVYKI